MKRRIFLDDPYFSPYKNRKSLLARKKGLLVLLLFLMGIGLGLYLGNSHHYKQYSEQFQDAYIKSSEFANDFVHFFTGLFKEVISAKSENGLTASELSSEALLFPIANAAPGEPAILLVPIWAVIKQINELN